MTALRLLTVLLACLAGAALANAPIYKYVDAYGNVTYSNIPVPGAKRSTLPPVQINPYTPPSALLQNRDGASRVTVRPQASPDPRGSAPASPGGYPVIDSATCAALCATSPCAMARATGSLTAPCCVINASSTPSSSCFARLE